MNNAHKIKNEALQLFASYVAVVQKTIRETVDGGSLIVLGPFHPRHFLDVLKKLEETKEFISLGATFSNAYGGSSSTHSAIGLPLLAIGNLQNYFRRSRVYLDIIKGNPVDINGRFEELWSAFNKREEKKTTISPINFVRFPEELINLGKFKIQKFSKDELDSLLEQEICEAFYPYAAVDTQRLSLFWHIIEECVEPKNKENLSVIELGFDFDWEDPFKVQRTFPDRTLQLIALFDWNKASDRPAAEMRDSDLWLECFNLPFRHTVSSDIIKSPMAFPDLSQLVLAEFSHDGDEYELPQFEIDLTVEELCVLKNVVRTAHDFLGSIDLQKCDWEFLDIAMGSLAKAFFSDGVELLLWDMIALEALIGEKKETTQNILRRVGLICGERDKKKIDGIRKEFKEIYEFRSSLVHGSKFSEGKKEKNLYRYHLRLARDYARKTVLWFILCLSHIHSELKKNSIPLNKYPKQKDILLVLDYQIQSFEHEGITIIMPKDFPAINFVEY